MADNNTTLTLLTDIPSAALSNLHRVLLEAMGFGLEESGPDQTYIYAEDPHLHLDDFDGDEETSLTAEDRQSELYKGIVQRGDDEYWVDVLRDVLKADAMKDVKHLDVMASYTCSKARPGEHGGWSARITREGSMFTGTHDAFRQWDQEYQLVTDLAILCDAMNTVSASPEQKEAQARVSDYITNHPAVEYAEG